MKPSLNYSFGSILIFTASLIASECFAQVTVATSIKPKKETIIFHAGEKRLLDEDVKSRTIPVDAWNKFIFGKTNYDLLDYRKGLYGSDVVSETELYATDLAEAGKVPWVMAIHIKPECMDRGFYSPNYQVNFDKPDATRFGAWYLKNHARYSDIEKSCAYANSDFKNGIMWKEEAMYDVGLKPQDVQDHARLCGSVLNDFLNDPAENIRVVGDQVNGDHSSYIRDRSCISTIEGTPEENFRLIFSSRISSYEGDFYWDDWVQQLYGQGGAPGEFPMGNTVFLLEVLSLAQPTSGDIEALKLPMQALSNWIKADPPNNPPRPFTLSAFYDNPHILMAALEAFVKASSENSPGRLAEFQSKLQKFLSVSLQEIGQACQSNHGVKEERMTNCQAVVVNQSTALLNLLGAPVQ